MANQLINHMNHNNMAVVNINNRGNHRIKNKIWRSWLRNAYQGSSKTAASSCNDGTIQLYFNIWIPWFDILFLDRLVHLDKVVPYLIQGQRATFLALSIKIQTILVRFPRLHAVRSQKNTLHSLISLWIPFVSFPQIYLGIRIADSVETILSLHQCYFPVPRGTT